MHTCECRSVILNVYCGTQMLKLVRSSIVCALWIKHGLRVATTETREFLWCHLCRPWHWLMTTCGAASDVRIMTSPSFQYYTNCTTHSRYLSTSRRFKSLLVEDKCRNHLVSIPEELVIATLNSRSKVLFHTLKWLYVHVTLLLDNIE